MSEINHRLPAPVIFGCEGTALTEEEKSFFGEVQPAGFILFTRNCENAAQIKDLVKELKACVSHREVLILIDQEGGRVRRLRGSSWRKDPAASVFTTLYHQDKEAAKKAVYLNYRLIAQTLYELGINVNCAPVLDILFPGYHDIVGDRALGDNPDMVSELGREACCGLLEGGVLPVVKHIPGHGRSDIDSHEALPRVRAEKTELEKSDFVPFKKLSDMPLAMTAHILYEALDDRPATLSPEVMRLIREEIGFNGLVMTDDLSMKALAGSFARRAKSSLEAGCDMVLHCNGKMEEMREVARGLKMMSEASHKRHLHAWQMIQHQPKSMIDRTDAEIQLGQWLKGAA